MRCQNWYSTLTMEGPWYKEFYWIFQLNLYYSLYLRQLSLMNTDCAALAFPAAIWWFFRANQEHIIVFYSGFANHICHQRFHKSTPDERHLLFFFQKYLTVFAKIETNSVTRKRFLYCMKKSFKAHMIAAICNISRIWIKGNDIFWKSWWLLKATFFRKIILWF